MDETKSEPGNTGSWWSTLPGLVTALAALLTAVGGLLVTLNQLGWLPKASETLTSGATKSDAMTQTTPSPAHDVASHVDKSSDLHYIEGIKIKVVAARRIYSGGEAFIDLVYIIITGSINLPRHDPFRFVRLVSNGTVAEPVSASVPAMDLSPNSRQEVSVRFRALPDGAPAVFRFGEQRFLDVPVEVTDRS